MQDRPEVTVPGSLLDGGPIFSLNCDVFGAVARPAGRGGFQSRLAGSACFVVFNSPLIPYSSIFTGVCRSGKPDMGV